MAKTRKTTENVARKPRKRPHTLAVKIPECSEVNPAKARDQKTEDSAALVPSSARRTIKTEAETQIFQSITQAHYDELAAVWDLDKRTPTVASRRAWALARNIKPEMVHRWFHRRKQLAKKARLVLPQDTYDMPVDTPPVIVRNNHVQKENSSPEPMPEDVKPRIKSEDTNLLLSSDDRALSPSSTLCGVSCHDSYPDDIPSSPSLAAEAHSTHISTALKVTQWDPSRSSSPVQVQDCTLLGKRPNFDSTDHIAATALSQSIDICSQDPDSISSFTCPLCQTGKPSGDCALNFSEDAEALWTYPSHYFPLTASQDNFERILISAENDPLSLFELSAIPFISRSPDLIKNAILDADWCHIARDSFRGRFDLQVLTPCDEMGNGWCVDGFQYSYDGSLFVPSSHD